MSETGLIQIDPRSAALTGASEAYLRRRAQEKLQQMAAKRRLYGRPLPAFADRTVLLVDDGIATGSSMLLAARALKEAGAKRVVIAAPVAPAELIPALERVADEVVIVHPARDFMAVGQFYRDFHQLGDDEVITLLSKSA